jgi:peptidoglycan/LPS O-acetylase OafA/YrhL
VLVGVAAYARWWAPRSTLDRLRADALATLGYVANWRFAFSGQSYFDTQIVPSPLRHAWSLAVEEQFYLLFPLLALACFATRRPRRTLAVVAASGALLSALLMAGLVDEHNPSVVYYGTHTRAQALLVGVWLAAIAPGVPALATRLRVRAAWHAVGAASLVALGAACFAIDEGDALMYRGGYLAVAAVVAVLIASSVRPGPIRGVLSVAPLRWIGQRSYGLYLWHFPAIVALEPARTGLEGVRLAGLRLAVTIAGAALSYRLVEVPILTGRLPRLRFASVSFAGAAALVAGFVLATTGGTAPPPALAGVPGDARPLLVVEAPGTTATTGTAGPTATGATGVTATTGAVQLFTPRTVAVVGDSVAASAMPGMRAAAETRGLTLISFVVPGCGVATAEVVDDLDRLIEWSPNCPGVMSDGTHTLVRDHDPDVIVWWSSWETANRRVDGRVLEAGSPGWIADLDAALEAAWQRLAAGGARIVVVDTTPRAASPVAEADRDREGRNAALRARLAALAQRHAGSTWLVRFSDVLCPDGPPCPREIAGTVPRPDDGGHFTEDTAGWAAEQLWPLLVAAWEQPATGA